VVDLVQLLMPSDPFVIVPLVSSVTTPLLGTASPLIVVELLARVVVAETLLPVDVPYK